MSSGRPLIPILLTAVGIFAAALVADLVVKSWAWSHFVTGETWQTIDRSGEPFNRVFLEPRPMPQTEVVPYGLNLTAVANQGAAMGMGQGNRPLFLAVGVVACLALSGFFVHSIRLERRRGGPTMLRSRVYRGTLAMLLAGVVGNFYDRLAYGYVRDMFHMLPDVRWSMLSRSLPDHEVFPWVFNLADSYLCVGVTVILFLSLFLPEPEPTLDDEASA